MVYDGCDLIAKRGDSRARDRFKVQAFIPTKRDEATKAKKQLHVLLIVINVLVTEEGIIVFAAKILSVIVRRSKDEYLFDPSLRETQVSCP